MSITQGTGATEAPPNGVGAPPIPSSSGELITVLAHFHRAEIARMSGWRDRIDLTTNWAITVVAAMLSVSLSTPSAHHGVILFAMLVVLLLLCIEARRYRFFDVYRTRVRLLERNYYAHVFAAQPGAETDWARQLGQDLREPRFLTSMRTAMSRRLRRNYFWMFLMLLAAWTLKISSPWLLAAEDAPDGTGPARGVIEHLAFGPVAGWAVLILVGAFYCWLAWATFRPHTRSGELAHGEVHV